MTLAPSVASRIFKALRHAAPFVVMGYTMHAAQAADYPARPVEIVVPWAVGGGSDAVARAFADAATRSMGQPFIVVNRPGASGSIGHQEGASARADGYKVTLVTPEISLAYLQGIGKTQWQDFAYVARINADPIALVVKADSPWTTLEQFLDHARANPGKATISNSGVGATYHLAAIAVEKKTGLSFNNIPYIGAGPAVVGLMGGQVDATFATTGEVGVHVKGGKLRMLAVMADQRLKDFGQVPTFRERQIDVQLGTWRALAAPKATPLEIVATLKRLVDKVSQDSGYREFFARQYLGLVNEDGEKFRLALEREHAFYTETVGKLQLGK
jgi:tripartite-type tricarboxylate transporter receptor subunit TctC